MSVEPVNWLLRIGSLNYPYIFSNQTKHWLSLTSADRDLVGWADAHDICCFQETRLGIIRRTEIEGMGCVFRDKDIHLGCGQNCGVAIAIKKNLPVIECITTENMPDCLALHGRFIAVKIALPTNGGTAVHMWIASVYAPAVSSDRPSQEHDQFYSCLTIVLNRLDSPFVYLAGDFNGCIDPAIDRFNTSRLSPPNRTYGDRALSEFLRYERTAKSRAWVDPIYLVAEYDHACSAFHTHRHPVPTDRTDSTVAEVEETNVTYTRIDHIFASSPIGLTAYYAECECIDGGQLHITHYPTCHRSDHRALTLDIDLHCINQAFNPHLYQSNVVTRGKLPGKHDPNYEKLVQHLDKLRPTLEADETCNFILNNPNSIFTRENMHSTQINSWIRSLQQITGESIPGPFRKTFDPLRPSHKWTPKIYELKRFLNACRQVNKAVHMLYRNRTHLHTYSTAKLRSCKDRIMFPYSDILPDAQFALSHFQLTDEAYLTWKQSLEELRSVKRDELHRENEAERIRVASKFKELYKQEAAKQSHIFRSIVFPTPKGSHAAMTLISSDGSELIISAEGVKAEYKSHWEKLGKPAQPRPNTPPLDFFTNITDPIWDKIKEDVNKSCKDITKPISKDELQAYVKSRSNTAPSRKDKTTNQLLKLILSEKENTGLTLNGQVLLTSLETLLLGLLNSILETGVVPEALLEGEIVPLHKSGDIRNLSNYRGITLLSCIYKMLTGILTTRISSLCESKGAFTAMQGGFRRGQSCLTKIATVQNIVTHAHRHKQPLYIFSSDIRKAFDTARFDAFNLALQHLGLDDRTVRLLDNLQQNFTCEVRTPFGHTEPFKVYCGAKQGCPLSPLKFIILFDVFLRHISAKGMGYKWGAAPHNLRSPLTKQTGQGMNIPGCALADDLILFSSSKEEFDNMVRLLDEFLSAAGMAMAPQKCQAYYIHAPENEDLSPVKIHDYNGQQLEVHWKPTEVPLSYLGYLIPIIKGNSHVQPWTAHVQKVFSTATETSERLKTARIAPKHAAKLANSDIFSSLTYFLQASYLSSLHKKKLQSIMWPAVRKKLKLWSCTPRAMVFSKKGFGVHNINAIYTTGALHLMLACLQTTDDYCRTTTLETIKEIQSHRGINTLDPPANIQKMRLPSYPPFYKTTSEALHMADMRIVRNPSVPIHKVFLHDTFFTNVTGLRDTEAALQKLRESGYWTLRDLLPNLTRDAETGECTIERWITREPSLSDVDMENAIQRDIEVSTRGLGFSPRQLRMCAFICGQGVRKLRNEFITNPASIPFLPCHRRDPIIAPPMSSSSQQSLDQIASDGSYSQGQAGLGVASGNRTWYCPIPGLQSNDRAEAFALALAVKLAVSQHTPEETVPIIFSDSKSTIDSVNACMQEFRPNKKRVANNSIIQYICSMLNNAGVAAPVIRWVKAHTGLQDPASVLNDKADTAANLGRSQSTPGLTVGECYDFLPEFYPMTKSCGEIIENNYYSRIYHAVDARLLQNNTDKAVQRRDSGKKHSKHLLNLTREDVWQDAAFSSFSGKCEDPEFYMHWKNKLLSNSLPSPYIKGIMNARTHPALYRTDQCELCHMHDQPDVFHYMCACGNVPITIARHKMCNDLANRIQGDSNIHTVTRDSLLEDLFPLDRNRFTFGLVPVSVEHRIDTNGTGAKRHLQTRIQPWITEGMHQLWIDICNELRAQRMDFHTRMRDLYGNGSDDAPNVQI